MSVASKKLCKPKKKSGSIHNRMLKRTQKAEDRWAFKMLREITNTLRKGRLFNANFNKRK